MWERHLFTLVYAADKSTLLKSYTSFLSPPADSRTEGRLGYVFCTKHGVRPPFYLTELVIKWDYRKYRGQA